MLMVTSILSPASAIDQTTTSKDTTDVSIVSLSPETAQLFFEASVEREASAYGSEGVEKINNGIVAYSNGYVKQQVLTIDSRTRGGFTAWVTDHWYRLSNAEKPVCDVTIRCTFYYDGNLATADKSSYNFDYYIYSDFRGDTYVREKDVKFKNGFLLSTSARVDATYSVNFMTLLDNETISLECSKDGDVTRYGQNESI